MRRGSEPGSLETGILRTRYRPRRGGRCQASHAAPPYAALCMATDSSGSPESTLPPWQRLSSELVHWMLYILLLATALSGWLFVSFRGWTISHFFLFPLPMLATGNAAALKTICTRRPSGRYLFSSGCMCLLRSHLSSSIGTALCGACSPADVRLDSVLALQCRKRRAHLHRDFRPGTITSRDTAARHNDAKNAASVLRSGCIGLQHFFSQAPLEAIDLIAGCANARKLNDGGFAQTKPRPQR